MPHKSLIAIAASLLAAPAIAGNLSDPVQPIVAPLVAPVGPDWSGFYGGLQLEMIGGSFTGQTLGIYSADVSGEIVSGFVGYRYDLGRTVIGLEFDIALAGEGQSLYTSSFLNGSETPFEITSAARLGVEFGYEVGAASLAYASLGAARLDVDTGNALSGNGFYVGLGYDHMINDDVTVGVEANFHRLADYAAPDDKVEPLTIGVNAAYRF